MIQTNYFAAETAIVERLKEQVPQVKNVLTPFSVADMIESSQGSPSIHVMYSGDIVAGNDADRGSRRTIDQRWTVVLAVRTAKAQLQNTTEARVIAGEIVPLILTALQGWQPTPFMQPLKRVSSAPAGYSSSFAYFPFAFEGRILT